MSIQSKSLFYALALYFLVNAQAAAAGLCPSGWPASLDVPFAHTIVDQDILTWSKVAIIERLNGSPRLQLQIKPGCFVNIRYAHDDWTAMITTTNWFFTEWGFISRKRPPPSGECKSAQTPLSAIGHAVVLGLSNSSRHKALVTCPSVLTRTDISKATGMTLVLDDWTVMGDLDRGAIPLATASDTHAKSIAKCFSGIDAEHFLVVNQWEHPDDHPRYMPRPEVNFTESKTLVKTLRNMDPGRVTIRVEIGEDESVRGVEILHSTVEVPKGLVQSLRQEFDAEYVDDRRHRFSYYAIFETGRGTGALLVDSFIALPKCGPPPPRDCR